MMAKGKNLGRDVQVSRDAVKNLTNKVEQIRKENALRGNVDHNGDIVRTPEEDEL